MQNTQIGKRHKLLYSAGAIAYGVKDNGFTTFLMIYYNQVLGLSAFYTGLAILIALMFDALSDPFVGHVSDRWKSKLGRRHPFMYAAILPIALSYYFLWHVPSDMAGFSLFIYLTVVAVMVRLFITFFEVPNSAMVAEISKGYDERTSLMSLRVTVGWLGGVAIAIVAYVIYLVPTGKYAKGILNLEGYEAFSIVAIVVMVVAMLISALGTHRLIAGLPQPNPRDNGKLSFVASLKGMFHNPSFNSLFIASLFSMMAFGIIITLQIYYATFFFGLTTKEISLFPLIMVLAALLSLALTPVLSRGYEKKSVLKFLAITSLIIANLTIVARLAGVLPENGTELLLPILLVHILVSTAVLVALQSVLGSMTADLVEDTERVTGHRVEGLYFAAISFSKKVVSGMGIFASGVFLSSAGEDGQVMTSEIMTQVSYLYIPFVCLLYLFTYIYAGRYQLSRQDHEDNLTAVSQTR
jgi:glycoside/pentoside/hexuronide:cation symporter, GPH family